MLAARLANTCAAGRLRLISIFLRLDVPVCYPIQSGGSSLPRPRFSARVGNGVRTSEPRTGGRAFPCRIRGQNRAREMRKAGGTVRIRAVSTLRLIRQTSHTFVAAERLQHVENAGRGGAPGEGGAQGLGD